MARESHCHKAVLKGRVCVPVPPLVCFMALAPAWAIGSGSYWPKDRCVWTELKSVTMHQHAHRPYLCILRHKNTHQKGRTAWVHGLGRGSTGPAALRTHGPQPGPGPTASGHLQTALAYCGGRCSQEAQREPHVSIFNVLVASPRWCVWLGGLSSSL